MKKSNAGFWAVIIVSAVAGVGFLAYRKYVQPKVETTKKIFGIF